MGINKELRKEAQAKAKAEAASRVVYMKFTEDKFYNDLTKPHFLKGRKYKVEGEDMIQRWLKRGGEIVDENYPESEPKEHLEEAIKHDDPAEVVEALDEVLEEALVENEAVAEEQEKSEDTQNEKSGKHKKHGHKSRK